MKKKLAVLIVFAILLVASSMLASSGFVFSSQSPAPGSTIKITNPTISTVVTANANINSATVKMFVDGQQVTHTFKYYYNAWTRKYDYKRGTISFNATALAVGAHQILVQATDVYGNPGETSWEFVVAGPPVISNFYPANNSKLGAVKEVSAVAKAVGSEVNPQSIVVKINNVAVPVEKVAYDATTGKILVAYPDGLAGGNYNVYMEVTDSTGYKGTATWSFAVISQPPQFTVVTPAAESTVSVGNPKIELKIQASSNINKDSVKLLMNGQPAAATFAYNYDSYTKKYDYTKGTLMFQPAVLPNGTHEATAEATDIMGNRGVVSWIFTVMAPPKIMEIFPGPNSNIADRRPVISIDLYSAESLTSDKINFSVQGNKINPVKTDLGNGIVRWSYQPIVEWKYDDKVLLDFSAENFEGLKVSKQWYYLVSPYKVMPGTSDVSGCVLCHDGTQIKQQLCGNCHTYDIPTWQSKCFDCHLTGTPPKQHHRYSTFPHDALADHLLRPDDLVGCRNCHSRYLTLEHSRSTYTCSTCHQQDTTPVKTEYKLFKRFQEPITMQRGLVGNTECFNCHTTNQAVTRHTEHRVSHTGACVECHGSGMISTDTTTVGHQDDCISCHGSTDPNVRQAIELQKNSCIDCHTSPHGVYMAALRDDIPLYSGNGMTWSIPQDASIWADDGWLPNELSNSAAKVVFSSRANVTAETIRDYYAVAMESAGWTQIGSTFGEGPDYFQIKYQKSKRYFVIWYYKGDVPNEPGTNPEGARLQIAYH